MDIHLISISVVTLTHCLDASVVLKAVIWGLKFEFSIAIFLIQPKGVHRKTWI